MNTFQLLICKKEDGQWVEVKSAQGRSISDLPDFLAAYDAALDALDAKDIRGMRVMRNSQLMEEDVRS